MKRLLFIIGIVCLSLGIVSSANASLIFYEPFNYTYGALTVVSFGVWSTHGGTAPLAQWSTTNIAGDPGAGNSLAYIGITQPTGDRVYKDKAYSEDLNRKFSTVTPPGVLYYSLFAKVTELPTTEHYFSSLGEGAAFTTFPARLFAKTQGSNINFGISFKGAAGSYSGAVGYPINQTHLIVVKLTMLNGVASDSVSIWVDPSSLGGTEPTPDITVDNGGGANVTAANGIRYAALRAATAPQHGDIEFDEYRVADTWAEVTPTASPYVPVELSSFKTE